MTTNPIDSLPITFEHRSIIPTTIDAILAFHEDPAAFRKLTPPPIFVQIHRREWRSISDAEIEFTLWFALLPIRWIARHEPGPTPTSFIDRQVKGPVEVWVHRHLFNPVPGGVELIDRLTILHRKRGFWAFITPILFGQLPLRLLFFYRHLRTHYGVKAYERNTIKV